MSTVISQSNINRRRGDAYTYDGGDPNIVVKGGVYLYGFYSGIQAYGDPPTTVYNYGSVHGGYDGVSGNNVVNYNKIGSLRTAVEVTNSCYNYGDITANDTGVQAARLINNGTITAKNVGVQVARLVNNGQIDASQGLYVSYGTAFAFVNNGSIAGTYGIGCRLSAPATVKLTNKGTMPRIDLDGDAMVATVTNSGTVSGGVTVAGSGATARITNTGTIDGDLDESGLGTLFLDDRGGTITGRITGTKTADTIHGGSNGETIDGGGGHDQISLGAGADTLDLTYLNPTFRGEADDPYVYDFGATDTMVLDGDKFTSLRPGATPEFAVGAAAASQTDYLFYNPQDHWLYYDADGSSGLPAHAIAQLDPHSVVSASSFKVV